MDVTIGAILVDGLTRLEETMIVRADRFPRVSIERHAQQQLICRHTCILIVMDRSVSAAAMLAIKWGVEAGLLMPRADVVIVHESDQIDDLRYRGKVHAVIHAGTRTGGNRQLEPRTHSIELLSEFLKQG